jgi:hypothetical protein
MPAVTFSGRAYDVLVERTSNFTDKDGRSMKIKRILLVALALGLASVGVVAPAIAGSDVYSVAGSSAGGGDISR